LLSEENTADQREGHQAGQETIQGLDEGAAMSKEQRFASVWDAIEDTPQQAASMRARSALMMELESIIKQRGMTQAEAAALFGVTQPRVSDLMRGKISLFSLDCLIDMAAVAGLEPHVTIKKPKATRKRRNEELAAA
jgi:predicted XRE-type DNA-binding protein